MEILETPSGVLASLHWFSVLVLKSAPPSVCPRPPHCPLGPSSLPARLDGGPHALPAWQVVSAVPTHCMPASASSKKKKKKNSCCAAIVPKQIAEWGRTDVPLLDFFCDLFFRGCVLLRVWVVMLSVCSGVRTGNDWMYYREWYL